MRSTVQRFSSERTGRVKYSTSCPWRRDSPSAASRAIPTSLGEVFGSRGREAMGAQIFAICSPILREEKRAVKFLQLKCGPFEIFSLPDRADEVYSGLSRTSRRRRSEESFADCLRRRLPRPVLQTGFPSSVD